MPLNPYIRHNIKSTQEMYESLVIQAIRALGIETYYIPRKIVQRSPILGEVDASAFDESYMLEAYVASIDSFEGDGFFLSSFGMEVKNQMKLVVSRRRFQQLVGRHQEEEDEGIRPNEGDLIYVPVVNSLFEVQFVDGLTPFHQLQNIPTYTLTVELFRYNNEDLETGIEEIDAFDRKYNPRTTVDLATASTDWILGETVTQSANGITITGEIAEILSSTQLDIINIVASDLGGDTIQITDGISIQNLVGAESGVSIAVTAIDNFIPMENDPNSTNNEFENIGNNFLDLSIINPFGVPDTK